MVTAQYIILHHNIMSCDKSYYTPAPDLELKVSLLVNKATSQLIIIHAELALAV